MATLAVESATREVMVGMGQIAAGRAPVRMKAVLGSCIALALHHPRLKTGAMAHIVLPESAGRAGAAGKFADTALPEMLRQLSQMGTPTQGLVAVFAGAANMFGSSGPLQIGEANVVAVTRALGAACVRITGKDVGGSKGRRVVFDCASGQMTVECPGHSPRRL